MKSNEFYRCGDRMRRRNGNYAVTINLIGLPRLRFVPVTVCIQATEFCALRTVCTSRQHLALTRRLRRPMILDHVLRDLKYNKKYGGMMNKRPWRYILLYYNMCLIYIPGNTSTPITVCSYIIHSQPTCSYCKIKMISGLES